MLSGSPLSRSSPGGPNRRSRLSAVLLAAAVALSVTACGSAEGPALTPEQERLLPTGTPSPAIAYDSMAPRDSREVAGEGFTLSVPADFQQEDTTSSNGEPMTVVEKPSGLSELPIRVAVVRDVDPEQGALEQSYALEVSKGTLGATDVTRSTPQWPQTEAAYLVQWTEELPSRDGPSVGVRYWQLMAQVDESLILNVVGYAPVGEFEGSGIAEIVQSFRPSGGGA